VRGDAGQVDAAGAVPDDGQGAAASQQHGVHMDEAGGGNAAGLGGQELLPGLGSLPDRKVRALPRKTDRLALLVDVCPVLCHA
jgi:hypothetical protein